MYSCVPIVAHKSLKIRCIIRLKSVSLSDVYLNAGVERRKKLKFNFPNFAPSPSLRTETRWRGNLGAFCGDTLVDGLPSCAELPREYHATWLVFHSEFLPCERQQEGRGRKSVNPLFLPLPLALFISFHLASSAKTLA